MLRSLRRGPLTVFWSTGTNLSPIPSIVQLPKIVHMYYNASLWPAIESNSQGYKEAASAAHSVTTHTHTLFALTLCTPCRVRSMQTPLQCLADGFLEISTSFPCI